MPPPLRFELSGTMGFGSFEEVRAIAACAERLGLRAFHVSDHLLPVAGFDRRGPFLEAWTLLAALAASTQRIRLGVMVTGNTYRHPALLAKMAATVDVVSGGRLDFGLGAGWSVDDHRAYGLPFPGFRERLERLDEALALVRLLWTHENVDFEGRYYRLEGAPFSPRPVQKPHPPITLGGSSDRILPLVARHADSWNLLGSRAYVARRIEALERRCAEIGRDPSEIERSLWIGLELTQTEDEAERWVRKRVEQLVRVPPADDPSRRYVEAGASPEDFVRDSNLVGTPAQLRDQIERWAQLGISRIVLRTPRPFVPPTLERFVAEVGTVFSS